jgi:hypothetical protein
MQAHESFVETVQRNKGDEGWEGQFSFSHPVLSLM